MSALVRNTVFLLTLSFTVLPALAQISFQGSRPLQFFPAGSKKKEVERPTNLPRIRFRGWKQTGGVSQTVKGCEGSCFPTARLNTDNANRPLNKIPGAGPLFTAPSLRATLPAGGIPTAAAVGDFNGDGHLDWVISNGADNSVWLYLGNGSGASSLPTIIPLTGLAPTWVAVADLRNNGKLDLVVSEADSQSVGVLLGNGDGTFQPEVQYFLPAPPLFVLPGDFNGDGTIDIAVGMIGSSATGPVAVLPGDGQGHLGSALFVAADQPSVGAWLANADLNGDGKQDLIVVDPDDLGINTHGGAQIYLNRGNGTFDPGQLMFGNLAPPVGPPRLALSAALADLNGDSCPDVVLTDSYGLAVVFTGNCQGTVSNTPFSQAALGDSGGAIKIIDMNGDGKLDLVTSGVALGGAGGSGLGNVAGNLVSVLFGDGTGNFSSGRVYRGEPSMYSLAIGDLNGDGFPDIVTANQDSDSGSVFLNDGEGGLGDPQGEPIGYGSGTTNSPVTPFLFADLDGNGTTDMFLIEVPALYPGAMQITTMLNDGTGKFSPPIQSPAWPEDQLAPGDFVLADFRNIGSPDLIVIGIDTPTLFFAPNIGAGKFGPGNQTAPAGAVGRMAVGDFNGDGKLDFVAVAPSGTTGTEQTSMNVFLGNGNGTFRTGQSVLFGVPSEPQPTVYVGDFNRDGKLDVLIFAGGLYEMLGNGDGTFQPALNLFPTFGVFALADVNRDGLPDLIAMTDQFGNQATEIPTLSVFLGQSDGTFRFKQTYTPYLDTLRPSIQLGGVIAGTQFNAVLGDFNGDGNPDVAIFQYLGSANTMTFEQILFGNGDGTFTAGYDAYSYAKSYVPGFAADVNADGFADLVELDNYTSSFNVIKSGTNAPALQVQMLSKPVTGNTGYGRVILNVASSSTTTVTMTASDPNISVSPVIIPSGTVSQDFQFSVGSGFDTHHVFTIQAQVGTADATAYSYVSNLPFPVVELDPTALIFSETNVGSTSSPKSITVKNLGSAPIAFKLIDTLWPFSETTDCGQSLPPGGTCQVQVTFLAAYSGFVGGSVNLFSNGPPSSEEVNVEGFGLGLQVAPYALSFTGTAGTISPTQSVVVTNQETIPVQVAIQAPYPPDQGFEETNNCTTLLAGASCQVKIGYAPTQAGTFDSSTVQINQSYAINLYGNATDSDFALDTTSGSAKVSAGQTATYLISAQSISGFAGTVTLSCGGYPQESSCSASPKSVTLTSGQTSQVTITVTTTKQTTSFLVPPPSRGKDPSSPAILSLVGFVIFGFLGVIGRRPKSLAKTSAALLLLIMCSCGGSSNGGTGTGAGGGTAGTPPGNYILTVTGSDGALSHQIILHLTVD